MNWVQGTCFLLLYGFMLLTHVPDVWGKHCIMDFQACAYMRVCCQVQFWFLRFLGRCGPHTNTDQCWRGTVWVHTLRNCHRWERTDPQEGAAGRSNILLRSRPARTLCAAHRPSSHALKWEKTAEGQVQRYTHNEFNLTVAHEKMTRGHARLNYWDRPTTPNSHCSPQ